MESPSLYSASICRLTLLFGATLLLGFNGCMPDSGPRGVVGRFLEAIAKKDMTLAKSLTTPESEGMMDLIEKAGKISGDSKIFNGLEPAQVEIGTAKIEGNEATVPVKEKKSGVTFNYKLRKVDGSWKLAFDMGSLLEMTAGTIGEQVNRGIDSLKAGLDQLREIDFDTLAKQLREGQKAIDSMQRTIEQELKKSDFE